MVKGNIFFYKSGWTLLPESDAVTRNQYQVQLPKWLRKSLSDSVAVKTITLDWTLVRKAPIDRNSNSNLGLAFAVRKLANERRRGEQSSRTAETTLPIPFIDRRTLAKKAKDFKFPLAYSLI